MRFDTIVSIHVRHDVIRFKLGKCLTKCPWFLSDVVIPWTALASSQSKKMLSVNEKKNLARGCQPTSWLQLLLLTLYVNQDYQSLRKSVVSNCLTYFNFLKLLNFSFFSSILLFLSNYPLLFLLKKPNSTSYLYIIDTYLSLKIIQNH